MPPEIKANERIFLLVQFKFSVGSNLWRGTTGPSVSQVRWNRWVWMLDVSPTSCLSFIRWRFMFSAHLFFSLFPEEIRQIYIMVNKLSLKQGRKRRKQIWYQLEAGMLKINSILLISRSWCRAEPTRTRRAPQCNWVWRDVKVITKSNDSHNQS